MFIRTFTIGSLILTSVVGCGGSDQGEAALSTGGATGAGGSSATGGATVQSGGATAAGGVTAAGGMAPGNGGIVGAGGVVAAGGIVGAGGALAAGGAVAAGGAASGGAAGGGGIPNMPSDVKETSFAMDPFTVPPGGEFYKCQDFPNTFGKNIAVLESKTTMAPGSHHMFAFRLTSDGFYGAPSNLGLNNTKGPLVDCPQGGTEFHPYFHAAQTPVQEFTYPAGVGSALNTNETIRVMVHYLNVGTDPIHATMSMSMKYVGADEVTSLAASVFLNALNIRVPVGKTTQTFKYALPFDIKLLGASGHMHRRGIHFEGTAIPSGGAKQTLYKTDTWDEPVPAAFNPAVALASGTNVQWACSYNNDTGKSLTFGESASTNEMCILTGTYYPAPGGGGLYDQDFDNGVSTPN